MKLRRIELPLIYIQLLESIQHVLTELEPFVLLGGDLTVIDS